MTGDALAEMEHKYALDTICRINGRQHARVWVRECRGRGRGRGGKKAGNWEVGRVAPSLTAAQGFLSITTVSDWGTKAEKAQRIKDFSNSVLSFIYFLPTVILCFLLSCTLIGIAGEFWNNERWDKPQRNANNLLYNEINCLFVICLQWC